MGFASSRNAPVDSSRRPYGTFGGSDIDATSDSATACAGRVRGTLASAVNEPVMSAAVNSSDSASDSPGAISVSTDMLLLLSGFVSSRGVWMGFQRARLETQ